MKSAKERLAQSDGVAVQPVRSAKERLAQSPSMRVPSDTSAMPAVDVTQVKTLQPPPITDTSRSAVGSLRQRLASRQQAKSGQREHVKSAAQRIASSRPDTASTQDTGDVSSGTERPIGDYMSTSPAIKQRKPQGFMESLQSVGGGAIAGALDIDPYKTKSPLGKWSTEFEGAPGHTAGKLIGNIAPYALGGGIVRGGAKLLGTRSIPMLEAGLTGVVSAGISQGLQVASGEDTFDPKEAALEGIAFSALDTGVKGVGAIGRALKGAYKSSKPYGSKVLDELQEGWLDLEFTPTGVRRSPAFQQTKEAVRTHSVKLQEARRNSYRFIKHSKSRVTEQESKDMIAVLQGDKELLGTFSPRAKIEARKIRTQLDKTRAYINEDAGKDYVKEIDDYFPGFWEKKVVAKGQADPAQTFIPATQKKVFKTQAEGIAAGFEAKFDNVYDALAEYQRIAHKTTENKIFINFIKSMQAKEGQPFITALQKKKGDGYQTIRSMALAKAFTKRPSNDMVFVHPDIAKPVKAIFDSPLTSENKSAQLAIEITEKTNAISKKAILTASLFHPYALFESTVYEGINPVTGLYKGNKLLKNPRWMRDYARYMDMGTPSDAQRGIIRDIFDGMVAKTEGKFGAHQGAKVARWMNNTWDAGLWDKVHKPYKAITFETQRLKFLKKNPNATKSQIEVAKRAIGNSTDNAFGGQKFQQQLRTPQMLQAMHMAALAPDWNISQLKMFLSMAKTARGGAGSKLEGKLARKYWMRVGVVYLTAYNAANIAMSGHSMWDNPEDHKLDIDMGDGTFFRQSKQTKEPVGVIEDAMHFLGSKAAPFPQIMSEQFTNKTLGGYPAGIDMSGTFWESLPSRTKSIAKHFVPISFGERSAFGGIPITGKDTTKTNNARGSRRGSTTKRGQQGR